MKQINQDIPMVDVHGVKNVKNCITRNQWNQDKGKNIIRNITKKIGIKFQDSIKNIVSNMAMKLEQKIVQGGDTNILKLNTKCRLSSLKKWSRANLVYVL